MNYRDLTERLRDRCAGTGEHHRLHCLKCEAAEYIDTLRNKINTLEAPVWEKYYKGTEAQGA